MSDKIKYELEFPVKASPKMLFPFLSTPSGLSDWFCDDVNSRGERFTFFWGDSEETAKLVSKKAEKHIRFRWEEDEEEGNKAYFEFKIVVDDLTNDVSLIVTDHAEEDEIEESKLLWNSQVHELLHTIGS
ncbi:MAG: START-like domain-containing protein [Schleiferiaceae bacterium]